jgi:hypothetical protein
MHYFSLRCAGVEGRGHPGHLDALVGDAGGVDAYGLEGSPEVGNGVAVSDGAARNRNQARRRFAHLKVHERCISRGIIKAKSKTAKVGDGEGDGAVRCPSGGQHGGLAQMHLIVFRRRKSDDNVRAHPLKMPSLKLSEAAVPAESVILH